MVWCFFQLPVWYGSLCMFVPLKLESSTVLFENLVTDGLSTSTATSTVHRLGPTWGRYVPQRCRKRSQRPPGAKPKVQTWRVSWLEWHEDFCCLMNISIDLRIHKDLKNPTEAYTVEFLTHLTCLFWLSKPTFLEPRAPTRLPTCPPPTGVGTVRRLPMGSRELELPELKPKRSHWAPQRGDMGGYVDW